MAITFIIFAAIYALDRWLYELQVVSASNFNVAPAIWLATIANVLVAGFMLLLARYTLKRIQKNLFVALLFVLVGAILAFYPVMSSLYGVAFLPSLAVRILGPKSLFITAGAFLLVLGLLMFIPER